MQTFTKNEITWMLEAIKLTAEYYTIHSKRCAGLEASLAALRSEQLTFIYEKLNKALGVESKRIAIKY